MRFKCRGKVFRAWVFEMGEKGEDRKMRWASRMRRRWTVVEGPKRTFPLFGGEREVKGGE
jgi:hypothetical protein